MPSAYSVKTGQPIASPIVKYLAQTDNFIELELEVSENIGCYLKESKLHRDEN